MTPKTTTGLAAWAESDLGKIEWSKRKLERIFAAGYHDGRDNAISAKQLAQSLPVNDSTVRDIMAMLRDEDGLAIGSKGPGYYRVVSDADLAHEIEKRRDEIDTREKTITVLQDAYGGA